MIWNVDWVGSSREVEKTDDEVSSLFTFAVIAVIEVVTLDRERFVAIDRWEEDAPCNSKDDALDAGTVCAWEICEFVAVFDCTFSFGILNAGIAFPVDAGRSASGFCDEFRKDPRADEESTAEADKEVEDEDKEDPPEKEEEKDVVEAAERPPCNDTEFVAGGARFAREALPGGIFWLCLKDTEEEEPFKELTGKERPKPEDI